MVPVLGCQKPGSRERLTSPSEPRRQVEGVLWLRDRSGCELASNPQSMTGGVQMGILEPGRILQAETEHPVKADMSKPNQRKQ